MQCEILEKIQDQEMKTLMGKLWIMNKVCGWVNDIVSMLISWLWWSYNNFFKISALGKTGRRVPGDSLY